MSDHEPLPDRAWFTPLLNRIADAAGDRAALILGSEKACEKIYIPTSMTSDHWLAVLIGFDPAVRMAEAFGGSKLEIPPAIGGDKRRRARAIAEMIEKDYSTNVIARTLGISHNTVMEHRRKHPRSDAQMSLPFAGTAKTQP